MWIIQDYIAQFCVCIVVLQVLLQYIQANLKLINAGACRKKMTLPLRLLAVAAFGRHRCRLSANTKQLPILTLFTKKHVRFDKKLSSAEFHVRLALLTSGAVLTV